MFFYYCHQMFMIKGFVYEIHATSRQGFVLEELMRECGESDNWNLPICRVAFYSFTIVNTILSHQT